MKCRLFILFFILFCFCANCSQNSQPPTNIASPTATPDNAINEIEQAVREYYSTPKPDSSNRELLIKVLGVDINKDKDYENYYVVVVDVQLPDGSRTERIVNCHRFVNQGKTYWKITARN